MIIYLFFFKRTMDGHGCHEYMSGKPVSKAEAFLHNNVKLKKQILKELI